MRILSVMQCTELGGMEQASLRFMTGLQARGHSCQVVSVNSLGRLAPLLTEQQIPAVGVPFSGKLGWRSHLKLRRAIREASTAADALYMIGPTLSGVLALSKRRSARRVLAVHFHHTGVKPAWAWRGLYRLVTSRFDAVTFPSDFIRAEAEALWPALKPIAHTVRNPFRLPDRIDPATRAAARRALHVPSDAPVIGNAGWLIARKRFDIFLQTAASIRRTVPNAVFLIAGDGPERASLQALAERLGVGSSIHWLGWQRDLTLFYHAIDLLLFNAQWDAFPTTPLEAMSHGLPVVASLIHGGLGEVINNREHGFLIAEHDVDRLTAAAVALVHDSGKRAEVGERGRSRLAAVCDADTCVTDIERLLSGR